MSHNTSARKLASAVRAEPLRFYVGWSIAAGCVPCGRGSWVDVRVLVGVQGAMERKSYVRTEVARADCLLCEYCVEKVSWKRPTANLTVICNDNILRSQRCSRYETGPEHLLDAEEGLFQHNQVFADTSGQQPSRTITSGMAGLLGSKPCRSSFVRLCVPGGQFVSSGLLSPAALAA